MSASDTQLNLTNSKLLLDGTPTEQQMWTDRIKKRMSVVEADASERKSIYQVRRDFYVGNHSKYSNIVGIQQKEKKGHANAVMNYAGKTVTKIAYSLANNPPNLTFPVVGYKPDDANYNTEETFTQAVEDFIDEVLRRNMFWKRGYRRAVFNQVLAADFALKVYPVNKGTADNPIWEFKIVNHEKMENLLVGWRGDDTREFDYVIATSMRSVQSIKDEYGIEVKAENMKDDEEEGVSNSNYADNNQWSTKNTGGAMRSLIPTGKNTIPSAREIEYDDKDVYAIMIAGQLVQLVFKDNVTFPRMKFWILGENIPNPGGSSWSISDIDYIIDANIELNEASNEERDYIRVGANQKYVAYNMSDFDPESIKTGSGGVIFVDSADGTARFEALQTNVNTYPADTYTTRIKKHIHDLGIPEVTYGSSGGDSGRSKAIDYQSLIDLTVFKRDSWELVLTELCEKLQKLGYFYFKQDFFTDANTKQFKCRYPEYDWSDIVPITQSDKIVNVVNKVQMGLPFKEAYKELGYRDVDAVIEEMRLEARDPELMEFRSKMFQVTPGLVQAQSDAASTQQQNQMQAQGAPTINTPSPTLNSSQNSGGIQPMAQAGGTTSSSTGQGLVTQMRQNLQAQQGA